MIVTFLSREGDCIHSCTDCNELHEKLVEGGALKIKGTDYMIEKVETKINGNISLIIHLN